MLAVVAGIYTIYLAVISDDGLVVDDYYKQGLEINRTLERDQLAVSHGLAAEIMFNPAIEEVVLTLSANEGFTYPGEIEVAFLNATRSGQDKKSRLLQTSPGLYRGNLSALTKGKWYAQIEQDDWRITQTILIR